MCILAGVNLNDIFMVYSVASAFTVSHQGACVCILNWAHKVVRPCKVELMRNSNQHMQVENK